MQPNEIVKSELSKWREYSWTFHNSDAFVKVITYTGVAIEFDIDNQKFRIYVGRSNFTKKNYDELLDEEYRTPEICVAHYITKLFMMAQDFISNEWEVCYDHIGNDIYDDVHVLAQLKKANHIVTLTDMNIYIDDVPYFKNSIFNDFIVGEVVEDIHKKLFI